MPSSLPKSRCWKRHCRLKKCVRISRQSFRSSKQVLKSGFCFVLRNLKTWFFFSGPAAGGRKGSNATAKSAFQDWTPEQTAQQLTHMSKKLWDALSLWEFYDVVFTKKDKEDQYPNINALIRHVNRAGDWAKTLILMSDDPKKRAQGEHFFFFVFVCKKCFFCFKLLFM